MKNFFEQGFICFPVSIHGDEEASIGDMSFTNIDDEMNLVKAADDTRVFEMNWTILSRDQGSYWTLKIFTSGSERPRTSCA